jgi:hypothetical protein
MTHSPSGFFRFTSLPLPLITFVPPFNRLLMMFTILHELNELPRSYFDITQYPIQKPQRHQYVRGYFWLRTASLQALSLEVAITNPTTDRNPRSFSLVIRDGIDSIKFPVDIASGNPIEISMEHLTMEEIPLRFGHNDALPLQLLASKGLTAFFPPTPQRLHCYRLDCKYLCLLSKVVGR